MADRTVNGNFHVSVNLNIVEQCHSDSSNGRYFDIRYAMKSFHSTYMRVADFMRSDISGLHIMNKPGAKG